MTQWIPILTSIRTILSQEDFVACVAWADCQGYPIASKYDAEISKRKAESIVEDWREAKDVKENGGIPSLTTTGMTVKTLHAYLSKLLLSHPESAEISIQHVEFGQLTKSTEVTYDQCTNSLYIS